MRIRSRTSQADKRKSGKLKILKGGYWRLETVAGWLPEQEGGLDGADGEEGADKGEPKSLAVEVKTKNKKRSFKYNYNWFLDT